MQPIPNKHENNQLLCTQNKYDITYNKGKWHNAIYGMMNHYKNIV